MMKRNELEIGVVGFTAPQTVVFKALIIRVDERKSVIFLSLPVANDF
jgi:hypothetical protein